MRKFIVSWKGGKRLELHGLSLGCHPLSDPKEWEYVGGFPGPEAALAFARKFFPAAEPCYWCCPWLNHQEGTGE